MVPRGQRILVQFQRWLLSALLVTFVIQASAQAEMSPEHREQLELARRLENYGYHQSALHYYKIVERNAKLDEKERKDLGIEISAVEKKLAPGDVATQAAATLPELDDFPQFQISESLKPASRPEAPLDPREFPATRINKKKWIISSLIIVGVSIVGYKIYKHQQREPAKTIEVTF